MLPPGPGDERLPDAELIRPGHGIHGSLHLNTYSCHVIVLIMIRRKRIGGCTLGYYCSCRSSHLYSQSYRPRCILSDVGVLVTDDLSRSPDWRMCTSAQTRRAGDKDVVEGCARWHPRVQHREKTIGWTQILHHKDIGQQVALVDRYCRQVYPQEEIGPVRAKDSTLVPVVPVDEATFSVRI